MKLFVDLCGTGVLAAHVEPHQTIADLKAQMLSLDTPSSESLLTNFYFSCQGKPLPDSGSISSLGTRASDTLHLRVRICGGGGDGGATGAESRDCYLNMYAEKKPDKVDPNEARIAKWSRCALSSEALKPPCVIDKLGNLYNKEVLVSALLTKSLPKELCYIKGLKDMITIHLATVPGMRADEDTSQNKFQCPISGQELNGKYKFFALRTCGHVLSARALKEVQSSSCLVCYMPFAESDKLVINGTEDEVLELRKRMEEQSAAKLKEKREKKMKNGTTHELIEIDAAASRTVNGGIQVHKKVSERRELGEYGSGLDTSIGSKRNNAMKQQNAVNAISERSNDKKPSKRFKALDLLPQNATAEVYASIFSSSNKSKVKETFSCRALPLGRN